MGRCVGLASNELDVGERDGLQLLDKSLPGLQQFSDPTLGDEAVFGLLEDLQEAISHYQVCSEHNNLLNVDKGNRLCNKGQSMTKGADR